MAKKILFINQAIGGFTQGGIADMGKIVPTKVVQEGFEVRVFSPKWGNINERRGQLHEVIRLSGMNIIIKETDHPLVIKVASMPAAKSQAYFIDNDDYFLKRLQDVDEDGKPYDDNGERAVFYARGVLETVKKLRWIPDVIHCQGSFLSSCAQPTPTSPASHSLRWSHRFSTTTSKALCAKISVSVLPIVM